MSKPTVSQHISNEMDTIMNTLMKDTGFKGLYESIRSLLTEGIKKREVDWFPYLQLYPPGKLYHIQGNPVNGTMDDYDLLEEIAMRIRQGKSAGIIEDKVDRKNISLVEIEKEEFDHYSLHESLMDDHRMGNYVWGLCKLYDNHYTDFHSIVCLSFVFIFSDLLPYAKVIIVLKLKKIDSELHLPVFWLL